MKKIISFYSYSPLSLIVQAQDKSPNIILMIGDGMGLTQISAGMYANGNTTALEEFSYVGLSKTYATGSTDHRFRCQRHSHGSRCKNLQRSASESTRKMFHIKVS